MTVYLDKVFCLNTAVNYLLLAGSARLTGPMPKRRRLLAAAALGGVYAAAVLLPGCGWLRGLPFRLAVMAGMLLCAFGRRRALRRWALFPALSLAMSGLALLIGTVPGAKLWLLNGHVYYAIGAGTLILTAGALYCCAWLALQGVFSHTGGGILPAELTLQGRTVRLNLLHDTGNTLRDPLSGTPMVVVSWRVMAQLLPQTELQACAADPAAGLERLSRCAPPLRLQLVPYRAVGTGHGLLLAVRCDSLQIGKERQQPVWVAISPTEVEGGAYEGLKGD